MDELSECLASDPRTGRPFGDHGTALQAITFVLDINRTHEKLAFLRSWRCGDLAEWPEYYAWLKTPEGMRAA